MRYNDIYNIIRITFILVFNIGVAQVELDDGFADQITDRNTEENNVAISDTVKINKPEKIADIIDYNSEEQYFDVKNKFIYLVENAYVRYTDLEINADYIEVDLDTGDVYAVGLQDSLGKVIEPSKFKQAGREMEYNSFRFNLKTKKGTAYDIRTEESMGGDKGVVVSNVVKQYNDSISGMRKVAYTTDTYFIEKKDTIADYHLQTEYAKFMQGDNKTVVTGPIVMKIYNITTPLALPFAFLPLGSDRSAGLLMPSFGERESVGFYLSGLGFYFPIGDYLDITLTSDIYTKGSLALHANSQYIKKYKFNGNFNFDWERRIDGVKGLSDYSKGMNYNLRWSHRQDPKANPNLIFSANVNFRSSKFYREGIGNNAILSGDYLQNSANSSISLNKIFPNSPFSASLTLRHDQVTSPDTSEGTKMNFNLPTLSLNMNQIYPFAPKAGVKKGLLQNLGVSYRLNLENRIKTTEEDLFTSKMFDDSKNGAKHDVSLSTGTTIFKYFPINFSTNYNEVWYLKTQKKYWDKAQNKEITEEISGFDSYRTFNTGASLQTTLYGTKIFGSEEDDLWIKAIRHMITPSLGFSFSPDFGGESWGYYDEYTNDKGELIKYNRFQEGIYGGPSSGLQQSMSLSFANNLEMKVKSNKDSTAVRKIKIFDYLNIGTSYNFAAEKFKLSPISISGATSFFDNQVRVNFGARIDPYKTLINEEFPNGKKIDEIGDFKFRTYNIGLTYSLNSDTFGERKMEYKKRGIIRQEDYYFDEYNYAQFLTPWSLNLSLNHNHELKLNNESTSQSSVGINGRFSPTPHWNFSASTHLDLQTGKLTATSFSFSRDLRSFIINFNMTPFGTYKTWNFLIAIKASFLRDALKYEERNFNSNNIDF